jgi:hypothetical protein
MRSAAAATTAVLLLALLALAATSVSAGACGNRCSTAKCLLCKLALAQCTIDCTGATGCIVACLAWRGMETCIECALLYHLTDEYPVLVRLGAAISPRPPHPWRT